MIEIFCTSFFHIVDANAVRYSIASSAPHGYQKLPTISLFVPPFYIVTAYKKGLMPWEQYTDIYVSGLRKRYSEVYELLKTLSDKQQGNMELCCWENNIGLNYHNTCVADVHCHRELVADIINKTVAFESIKNIQASVHDLVDRRVKK